MKNRAILIILSLLFPLVAWGTVTWSAYWQTVTITAIGPKTAGTITVKAAKDENGFLNLHVQSNYSDSLFSGEIKDPHIESITIHRYSDSIEGYKDLFYVCLYYGTRDKTNYGSEENPYIQWQYNKVVYSFRYNKVETKIFKNNERWFPSDCIPGSFI
ncbi:hypothetical protein O0V09_17430 [Dasania sp. GY-19]|uniref:Uncharacterized protein n=2 Tax=Spongiibacteraceae TaxID=1706375 RepID=A0A9J6RQY2_9GAMM|nr:hypothetical protein [Dasania phycosphaerae]MCZ0866987.1 hypothetical protein [Dasania phycosphaerae]